MGIEWFWEEDGFHLTRLTQSCIHNFAQSVLLVSTTDFKSLRGISFVSQLFCFLQCLSRNYNCEFHQVIFLHAAF